MVMVMTVMMMMAMMVLLLLLLVVVMIMMRQQHLVSVSFGVFLAPSSAEADLRITGHEIPTSFMFQEFSKIVTFERERGGSGGVAARLGSSN